jgi:hypothetical protein
MVVMLMPDARPTGRCLNPAEQADILVDEPLGEENEQGDDTIA